MTQTSKHLIVFQGNADPAKVFMDMAPSCIETACGNHDYKYCCLSFPSAHQKLASSTLWHIKKWNDAQTQAGIKDQMMCVQEIGGEPGVIQCGKQDGYKKHWVYKEIQKESQSYTRWDSPNESRTYDVVKAIKHVQQSDASMEEINIEFSDEVIAALDYVSLRDVEFREQDTSMERKFGYVYAAWNVFFPDLIKIGATRRHSPYIRVRELSGAGVPDDFILIAAIPTLDPFKLESEIHNHFASRRRAGRHREFFKITKDEVSAYFEDITEFY